MPTRPATSDPLVDTAAVARVLLLSRLAPCARMSPSSVLAVAMVDPAVAAARPIQTGRTGGTTRTSLKEGLPPSGPSRISCPSFLAMGAQAAA